MVVRGNGSGRWRRGRLAVGHCLVDGTELWQTGSGTWLAVNRRGRVVDNRAGRLAVGGL